MFSYFFPLIDCQYGSTDRFEELRDGVHSKFYSASYICVDHVNLYLCITENSRGDKILRYL